jgi:CHAD domain-containing protein
MTQIPTTIGGFAMRVLEEQSRRFIDLAPATRIGHDTRAVHQMRVAARRMRAALRLFGEDLPSSPAEHLNTELKWAAGQLGQVRDLDVQLKRLGQTAAERGLQDRLMRYAEWLLVERQAAQDELLAALNSARFADLTASLHALGEWQPLSEEATAGAAARRMRRTFRALDKRARKLTPDAPTADFHKARIRAKRVRYAAEFFEPLYGKRARGFIKRLTAVQDILGDIQDGVVSTRTIETAAARPGAEWPADTLLALGQLLEHEHEHEVRQKREFTRSYADEVGTSWKKLEAELDIS